MEGISIEKPEDFSCLNTSLLMTLHNTYTNKSFDLVSLPVILRSKMQDYNLGGSHFLDKLNGFKTGEIVMIDYPYVNKPKTARLFWNEGAIRFFKETAYPTQLVRVVLD
jgi:hypothetical protein